MERWIPAIALFIGILWIRSNARRIQDENRLRKALYAVFFLLVPFLVLVRWGSDRLPFDRRMILGFELTAIAGSFWSLIHFFLKPEPKEKTPSIKSAS